MVTGSGAACVLGNPALSLYCGFRRATLNKSCAFDPPESFNQWAAGEAALMIPKGPANAFICF